MRFIIGEGQKESILINTAFHRLFITEIIYFMIGITPGIMNKYGNSSVKVLKGGQRNLNRSGIGQEHTEWIPLGFTIGAYTLNHEALRIDHPIQVVFKLISITGIVTIINGISGTIVFGKRQQ